VALFAVLGWNSGHHWDEYFYLYSSFMHSPAELLRYESSTAIFPPGFFTEKLGHVALLRVLTGVLGPGEPALYTIELLYALLLVGYFWASYRLLRELLGPAEARDSTLVLMFSPLSLYLAYKLLSEVPSLLFVTLASWALVRSLTADTARARRIALCLSISLLAVGALFRITGVAEFVGLAVALLVAGSRSDFTWRRVIGASVLIGAASAAIYSIVLLWYGGTPLSIFAGIGTVVTTHPPLERVFALACFVQTFALVLPFAWRQRARPAVRLAAIWLVCAGAPFLAGHEPRYYAPALTPLAVLSAVGLKEAASKLPEGGRRYAWLGVLAALVLINRLFLIPLMPYEVQQEQLLTVFHRLQQQKPGATYLVPWISDYSLLRFSGPAARVDLCLSVLPGGRISTRGHTGQLGAADRWWAGADHYVGSKDVLLKQPRPWRYLGWTYNPANVALVRWLGRLGLPIPKGGKLHNHLAGSWIWLDPTLGRQLVEHSGLYYVYALTPEAQKLPSSSRRTGSTQSLCSHRSASAHESPSGASSTESPSSHPEDCRL
jgi:hypothetical protein